MSDAIEVKIEQHRAGNRLTRKRAQRTLDRIEVRRELGDAQSALEQAIQNRDPEAITDARRAVADAIQRLRALT